MKGLDDPLCYNLIGLPGQKWRICSDDAFKFFVDASLIHAPYKKANHTYFGSFEFVAYDGGLNPIVQWNVLSVAHGNATYYVNRRTRKYRLNAKAPLEKMNFLNIYISPDGKARYGGVMGELSGREAHFV